VALDSTQAQGSAIDLGLPWRQWQAAPVASIGPSERQSLLKLCATPRVATVRRGFPLSWGKTTINTWPFRGRGIDTCSYHAIVTHSRTKILYIPSKNMVIKLLHFVQIFCMNFKMYDSVHIVFG
jgi:hypothetical protein